MVWGHYATFFFIFILFSTNCSAFDLSDLVLFLKNILGVSEIPQIEIECNKPYIKIGKRCCIDINENSMCDEDEKYILSKNWGENSTKSDSKNQPECLIDKDCDDFFCIHGKCSEHLYICGDGYCDMDESISICPQDCINELRVRSATSSICESNGKWIAVESSGGIVEYNPKDGDWEELFTVITPQPSIECLEEGDLILVSYDRINGDYMVSRVDREGNTIQTISTKELGCLPHTAVEEERGVAIKCIDLKNKVYQIKVLNLINKISVLEAEEKKIIQHVFSTKYGLGYVTADGIKYRLGDEDFKKIHEFESSQYNVKAFPTKEGDFIVSNPSQGLMKFNGKNGEIIWKNDGIKPSYVANLKNGNIMTIDMGGKRILEMNPNRWR